MFDDQNVPSNLPTGNQPPKAPAQPTPTLSMPEKPEPMNAPTPSVVAGAPTTPPRAGGESVEDMFDAVDGPGAPMAPSSVMDHQAPMSKKGGALKVILIIVVAVVLLALIAWGAFAILGATEPEPTPASNRPSSTTPSTTSTPSVPTPDAPSPTAPEPTQPVEEPDGDGDGLTDAEEARYGTAIHKPDTDNDGLFDREEVMVYRTNPLSADTDGDGFLDGSEVSNGYNPNGPGRLLELPTSKD